jgi:hypothetical protein
MNSERLGAAIWFFFWFIPISFVLKNEYQNLSLFVPWVTPLQLLSGHESDDFVIVICH